MTRGMICRIIRVLQSSAEVDFQRISMFREHAEERES